ncbi:MAG TPA: hypothetical protein VNL77_20080 [Roseiflexaceae bacterium]|nr:hypothetical protein [Roseiflexaceae bacterium]
MEPGGLEHPSAELERLAEEQINDLDSEGEDRVRRGKIRRERVVALYAQGAVESAQDNYHAALVMLYGDDSAHYDMARTFARRAAALGEQRAWSVVAAAWDRSLLARGAPQRFGTQFIRENGRWSLGEVDPRVSDAERAMYGVPPLWVQQQSVEQLQRREDAE